jgi:hypothetical protein
MEDAQRDLVLHIAGDERGVSGCPACAWMLVSMASWMIAAPWTERDVLCEKARALAARIRAAIPPEERERRERRTRADADVAASVEFYEAEAEARELTHPEHTTACLAAAEEKERERRAAMDEYIAIATAEHPMDKAAYAEVVRILTT